MANKKANKYQQHLNWFDQAKKNLKDFFFIAHDASEKEDYPQFFEDQVELNLELDRIKSLESNTVIIATYALKKDFDVQYDEQFKNCDSKKRLLDKLDLDYQIAGLNRRN